MSNRITNLTSSRNPLTTAISKIFQRETSAMKTTPLSAALGQPTDDKSNKKSSGKKATSADKKELSIKDKLDKVQPEAHRKGEEQSKYSFSAPSPKSNVAREALPARQEFHSEPKRLATTEKAERDHAGKTEKKERAEKSGKGGMPEKYVKLDKSEKSASSSTTSTSTTFHRGTTQRHGTSAAGTTSTTSTTSTATTTSLLTTSYSSERRPSLSSSGEDVKESGESKDPKDPKDPVYEDLSKLVKAAGKPHSPPQSKAKVESSGHSIRREKSPPSGTYHTKISMPQAGADRSAALLSSQEEEPTYENVERGVVQTHYKSKSPPERTTRKERTRHGRHLETSPPQIRTSPPQQAAARRTSLSPSEEELHGIKIPNPRKGSASSAVYALGPEHISIGVSRDDLRYQSIPPAIDPPTTRSAKATGGLALPPPVSHRGPATSQALAYGPIKSVSTTTTSTATHATAASRSSGLSGGRRASADEGSSSSSRRDVPKHKAALGKSRSYTTGEKPYDDSSFSDSDSGSISLSKSAGIAIGRALMEENFAAAKAAALNTVKPEKSGKPLWLPKPSDIAWKNDRHVDDDSDTASLENSSDSELGSDPISWEIEPSHFRISNEFITSAVAAVVAGDPVKLESGIASMKQAMLIAGGGPEHCAEYDEAFAQKLTNILFELMEHHSAARMRWFAEWTWRTPGCPLWKMEMPKWTYCYHPIVDNWRHDRTKLGILIEHCWHAGGKHSAYVFDEGVSALAQVLTTGESHPPRRVDLPSSFKFPAACLDLREQMKNVPPSVMEACRPGADKALTVGAARLVRTWIPILHYYCKNERLSPQQLHDYIKLACQHDSGYTIYHLLFTSLHPDLGAPGDVGIDAAIRKTERIRTHIKQVATAFGAKKILAFLQHWGTIVTLSKAELARGDRFSEPRVALLVSLIGPTPPYIGTLPDEPDMDIPAPVMYTTVHGSSQSN